MYFKGSKEYKRQTADIFPIKATNANGSRSCLLAKYEYIKINNRKRSSNRSEEVEHPYQPRQLAHVPFFHF